MTAIDDLASKYFNEILAIDPQLVTYLGINASETALNDYSSDGYRTRAELARNYLAHLHKLQPETPADQIAKDSMTERLEFEVLSDEAGERYLDMNVIASPLQELRMAFDLMTHESEEQWATTARRMNSVESSIQGYIATLEEGRSQGRVVAQRQAREAIYQAEAIAGSASELGYFDRLRSRYNGTSETLASDLAAGSSAASAAFAELARYLKDRYLPSATVKDGVGPERWSLSCRNFNGESFDASEAYTWGWEELHRIETEMNSVCQLIRPGASVQEVFDFLDHDPSRTIHGESEFLQWNQELIDATISAVNGTHFDIPEEIVRVQAMIAPPGGAAAMYYTAPSTDLTRPGRTWYPTLGKTSFPLWHEVSTVYHESVPGHHLQIGFVTYLGDRLNPFQRNLGRISGHIEGWALYAERLMDEFGYYDDPAYRLGMLASHAFRAARVVIDIGLHHDLVIPNGEGAYSGQAWNRDLAVRFMVERTGLAQDFASSEIDRYLGWPAQATSYKLGEKVWLETRETARHNAGSTFSLKTFHHQALSLGFVGLGQLRTQLENAGVENTEG